MSNDNIQREKELFVSFQYLRLMYDLDYITEQMKKSQYSNADSRGGVIQKYTTNPIKNIARDVSAPKQNKDRELVLERINVFREKNKNNNFNLFYDNKIEEVVKEVFKFDKYNSQFYLFSIQLAIDNEYEYIYWEGSSEKISLILYKSKNTLNEMYDKFKKHYLVLAKKPLSTTQRGILLGAGAVLAFAAFALPVAAVGGISAPAATTTGALALIGDMQIGVGMAGLLTFLVGGGLMGTTYKLLDSYNKREVMREFRKLDYKEVAQLFSVVLLRIDHAQKNNVKFSVQRIC